MSKMIHDRRFAKNPRLYVKKFCRKIIDFLRRKIKLPVQKCRIRKQVDKLLHQATDLTKEQAYELLKSYYIPEKSPFSQKTEFDIRYDLMIIVPVYNVEKYLRECIESLLGQKTKFSYQIVLINDGSTDKCDEILQDYENITNIKIIRQENRGLSGARNSGLKHISGRYVLFVDSDDVLENTAVETLMNVAVDYGADIVEGGFVYFGEDQMEWSENRTYNGPTKVDPDVLPGYPWGRIIRADYFEKLCFPEGFLYEDTIMHCLLYPQCKKVYAIPDVVYRYRMNPQGISSTAKDNVKCLDTFWMTKFCLEEKVIRGQQIDVRVHKHFLNQLRTNNRRLRMMPAEIQESVFVLSCGLYETYFQYVPVPAGDRFRLLNQALTKRSYKAFKCIMENWDLLA